MPKRQLSEVSTGNIPKEKEPVARKSSRAVKAVDYAEESESKVKKTKKEKVAKEEKEESSDGDDKKVAKKSKASSSSKACSSAKDVTPEEVDVYDDKMPQPKRNPKGELVFIDYPYFKPNLTPKEVLQMGSFGGTYFRPITSKVTGLAYKDVWKELPPDWLEGLDIKAQISSSKYDKSLNKYRETCGGDLEMWESSGWITSIDPYGWFMWYCRFFLGRRSSDDDRQIARGNGVIGPSGRWRNNLANKVLGSGLPLQEALEKENISPKIRQLLQHWGYKLTIADLEAAAKKKK